MTINVLITGVGGPVGQAIIKAARLSSLPLRLIGTDRHALSVGLDWVDRGFVLPDCSRVDDYLSEMIRVCAAERVAAILPGSEGELRLLSTHAARIRNAAQGTTLIASSPDVLRIALDKLETCRFLEHSALHFPRYASSCSPADVETLVAELGFPLFAKPRHGSGSQGVVRLQSREDLRRLQQAAVEFVVQEFLLPDSQEYTVAVFTDRTKQQIGSIVLRRELCAGNTYRAWVVRDARISQEARAVVRALGAAGPCNVQLRLTERGPVTFEINPRFSGTTAMRAHFGYNEVDMALRSYVRNESLDEPRVREGTALRFWDECYRDAA